MKKLKRKNLDDFLSSDSILSSLRMKLSNGGESDGILCMQQPPSSGLDWCCTLSGQRCCRTLSGDLPCNSIF